MPGGVWSTASLPTRSGTYIDFIAAVTAAISPGTTGTVGLIGTADWGPENAPFFVANQGDGDQNSKLGGVAWGGTLRDAIAQALDGFDDVGASGIQAYRAVGSAGANATLTLNDGSAAAALVLTGRFKGVRPNSWSVTVQTNAINSGNKDLLVYESGVQIAAFNNITGGTNDAAMALINGALSNLVTAATSGTVGRALANVVGVVAGAGGFAGGNSGTTLVLADYAAAQTAMQTVTFDAIALANVSDGPTNTQLQTWATTYNASSGQRTFAVSGPALGDSLAAALARSVIADNPDVVNIGAVDILRLADNVLLSGAYLAPRVAGAIAAAGLKRATTGMTWTGYRVNNPLSDSGYSQAVTGGVYTFRQDDAQTISVELGVTSQVTSNTTSRPVAHKQIRNVYIDHFIALNLVRQGNANRGSLLNTGAGVAGFLGNVLQFLKRLESNQVLLPGSSVSLDSSQNNTGSALFLAVGITYVKTVDQFLFTIQVA